MVGIYGERENGGLGLNKGINTFGDGLLITVYAKSAPGNVEQLGFGLSGMTLTHHTYPYPYMLS